MFWLRTVRVLGSRVLGSRPRQIEVAEMFWLRTVRVLGSGVCDPSESDRLITQKIKDALDLLEIRLLDHFVIGVEKATSLAELGWL